MYWGRILGAIFGFIVAGPIGLLLGLFVGNAFDRGFNFHIRHFDPDMNHAIQATFFRVTFQVMGYVAKSDGRVSEREIDAARAVMRRMGLNSSQIREAIKYFTQGKQATFSFEAALRELAQICHQRVLLQMFIEIQFYAAQAEGIITFGKQKILQQICDYLGFMPFQDFTFSQNQSQYQSRQSRSQHEYRNQQSNTFYQHNSLEKAYKVLNVSAQANINEIKRSYRRLMNQNHPDKLISKGLPPEMIKVATEKTQNIQAAYELIREARGL